MCSAVRLKEEGGQREKETEGWSGCGKFFSFVGRKTSNE